MDEQTLLKFCAKSGEIRNYMTTPIRRNGFIYATNGHIAVCIPDDGSFSGENTSEIPSFRFVHDAMEILADDQFKTIDVSMPEVEPCKTCGGTRKVRKCGDCDGDGVFQHGNHDYECLECDGDGWVIGEGNQDCPDCDGTGSDKYQTVKVEHQHLAVRYVELMNTLPSVRLYTPPDNGKTCFFKFDGGFGAVIPCRPR